MSTVTSDAVERLICEWCGVPLTLTDNEYGSGDYCPEGRAVEASGMSLHRAKARPTLDVERLAPEIVAYYKLYDHHDVWRLRGARQLLEWLNVRLTVAEAASDE